MQLLFSALWLRMCRLFASVPSPPHPATFTGEAGEIPRANGSMIRRPKRNRSLTGSIASFALPATRQETFGLPSAAKPKQPGACIDRKEEIKRERNKREHTLLSLSPGMADEVDLQRALLASLSHGRSSNPQPPSQMARTTESPRPPSRQPFFVPADQPKRPAGEGAARDSFATSEAVSSFPEATIDSLPWTRAQAGPGSG